MYILQYLDVQSAQNLAEATGIDDVIRDRLNPISYLGKTFKDPTLLFWIMTITSSLILGSRTLKYILLGVVNEDSN